MRTISTRATATTAGAVVAAAALAAATMAGACGGTTAQPDDGGADVKNDIAIDVATDAPADGGPVDSGGGDAPSGLPGPPDGGTPTSNVYTFAIDSVLLGESPRGGGAPTNTAWKDYGYNLDGLVTDSNSTNVCTLGAAAPKTNQSDGTAGIDNAFGAIILPIIEAASGLPNPSQMETQVIDSGYWTLQLQVTGLSDDPSQSALGLGMQIFTSGNYGALPTFDATTDWPVLSTSVNDGQTIASGSVVQFSSSYISSGTFVSGLGSQTITLPLDLQGIALPIAIHNAVVTFDHVDHADAANGTIAGVIDKEEFISALQAVAGQISVSLCGSAFDGIAAQIRQAADILTDGTNVPNVACTAISVGMGFTARLVANPTQVVPTPPPAPDPCGD